MIRVRNLTKRYARTKAVDDISFEVEKGQIVGFLGPNGAGKTTTMRVITGFLPPTEGTAEVAGFDVVKQPLELKKRIGYLPETPPLYPDMEVDEYLRFVGSIKGIPAGELKRRLDEVTERCSIGDVRQKLLGKLSKGYRQRVGLAQALIHNPEVLILDEPTSGLDPRQIFETRDLIKSLAGDHTIILSTHRLEEVEQTCRKAIIINKGKLAAADTVENLRNRLRGAESIHVEAHRGVGAVEETQLREAIEQIAGVSGVKVQGAGDGVLHLEVQSAPGKPVRAEVARAVIEKGWQLYELRPVATSLEEVYLTLTEQEPNGKPGGLQ